MRAPGRAFTLPGNWSLTMNLINTSPLRRQMAERISTDQWIAPDLATFGDLLPGIGTTEQRVPWRLRAFLNLPICDRAGKDRPGTVIIARLKDIGCVIARANVRGKHANHRFLWRRFAASTTDTAILASAQAMMDEAHEQVGGAPYFAHLKVSTAPTSEPSPVTPPALPLRPSSVSVGRMPDPELTRLYADAGDEMGRRGLLPPLPTTPAPAPAVPSSMTAADAWDFMRSRLSILDPELLRRVVADTSAERERRREALQAELAALG